MNKITRLDDIYAALEAVILDKQHPATGLLPASTSVNTHGDYTDAWVRDNVYSILAVWSLGMAYRRQGESERSDQLEQSTIKLMRGLLLSMMRQASKIEAFKHSFSPNDALHAKYDTATGLPVVADDAWGHLQLDATSLYLLMLAQMSASGLRIVRTFGEVDFIQNLVYYIASAYRTPDYGIWERGNKINNGKTEINASSVGMAKAALQALDGFNLFGPSASPRAVIHTVSDALSFARNTLTSLLPRESLSKEVDAALLSIIGFPAFAIGDTELVEKTRSEILNKLAGNYGCKRFLWDGHQTVIEDERRLYYEHSELANFENIESEWPLFYTYLYLHALFDEKLSLAQEYRQKLDGLMVEVSGMKLLPELYYVEKENVTAEKSSPHSQPRVPNENVPLVWAQSLYYTAILLHDGMITADDVDPCHMRKRSRQNVKTQIALVVLAENDEVKKRLVEHGVIAETLDEIAPVNVISAPHLMDMYNLIGANHTLGLTGRPKRRLNLATSQAYDINGRSCLCLSWLQSEDNEYRNFDSRFVGQNIKREVEYIKSQWYSNQAAVFTWLVDQRFCESENATELFSVLRDMQLRTDLQYVGYASASLAYRAARVNPIILPNVCVTPFLPVTSVDLFYINKDILTEKSRSALEYFENGDAEKCTELVVDLAESLELNQTVSVEGASATKLRFLLEYFYNKGQRKNYWLLARVCFNLLEYCHNDLADALTLLSARNMTVLIESDKSNTLVVNTPLSNTAFVEKMKGLIEHPLEHALVHEALTVIGAITRTEPDLFDGLRSINVQHLLASCIKCEREELRDNLHHIGNFSPEKIFSKIRNLFVTQKKEYSKWLGEGFSKLDIGESPDLAIRTDWLEWRSARGLVTHLDDDFLQSLWESMHHVAKMEFGDGTSSDFTLDCIAIRSSMTSREVIFAQVIDGVTRHLHPFYYKSLVIEALYAFCAYCSENSEVIFTDTIYFTKLLENTALNFVKSTSSEKKDARDIDTFLRQSPETVQAWLTQEFAKLEVIDQAS